VETSVYAQFSEDLAADLTRHVLTADPDLVVVPPDASLAPHDMLPRVVLHRAAGPQPSSAVTVRQHGGADGSAALQVGTQLAVSRGLRLVLDGAQGRRERGAVTDLARHGIDVDTSAEPDDAFVVGTPVDEDAHVVVRARPDEDIDDIDSWAGLFVAAASTEGQ
jgi:hypothetical protein